MAHKRPAPRAPLPPFGAPQTAVPPPRTFESLSVVPTPTSPTLTSPEPSPATVTVQRPRGTLLRRLSSLIVPGSAAGAGAPTYRTIYVNQPLRNAKLKYPGNRISTAKYNPFTFLFKFLFEQFANYANLFFLVTAIIQQIPGISPTNQYDTFLPLFIVLLITAIKEIVEDRQRHRSDALTNQRITNVLGPPEGALSVVSKKKKKSPNASPPPSAHPSPPPASRRGAFFRQEKNAFQKQALPADMELQIQTPERDTHREAKKGWKFHPMTWRDVCVGDILKVNQNEPFPADLIFLSSSEPDGICYIETKNLDGETNLKIKQCRTETALTLTTPDALGGLSGYMHSELPNSSLYTYRGKFFPSPNSSTTTPFGSTPSKNAFGSLPKAVQHPASAPSSPQVSKHGAAAPGSSSYRPTTPVALPSSSSLADLQSYPATLSFDHQQFLPRGAMLKNTQWVCGIVVFTGHETKLLRNASAAPIKTTSVTRIVNRQILALCVILFLISCACAVGNTIFINHTQSLWYLGLGASERTVGTQIVDFFKQLATFWLLFNNLVPISLIVTIEMVKYANARLISNDLNMFYSATDTPTVVRTSSLVEELGQVKYVFSDKTGTLTCNIMEFKECCVGGRRYIHEGHDPQGASLSSSASCGEDSDATYVRPPSPSSLSKSPVPPPPVTPTSSPLSSVSPHPIVRPLEHLQNELANAFLNTQSLASSPDLRQAWEFFALLSVCHTVIPDYSTGPLNYQASSPDEAALVKAAGQFGFIFSQRKPNEITIELGPPFSPSVPTSAASPKSSTSIRSAATGTTQAGSIGAASVVASLITQPHPSYQRHTYKILAVNEFNSARKRMSVLVQRDNEYRVYVKGADNIVLTLLRERAEPAYSQTMQALESYAAQGLRTLTLAYKTMDATAAEAWLQTYQAALLDLDHRDELLEQAAAALEQGLDLLGVTAVEDKLQDAVAETLAMLLEANIRVWMLTGDRVETAINIGYSCQMIQPHMQLMVVQGSAPLPAAPSGPFALVMDGDALAKALPLSHFAAMACTAACVICCRVSPLQKAQVVSCIQAHTRATTLAIGDGANDVSMIQAASIGVGIAGLEGMQAVQSADIAFAQFRFLGRLLLVHGYFSYTRLTKLILYSFYKNAALYLTQFWFAILNGFSGQTLYESWILAGFNVVFTAAPPLTLGIFDRTLSDETLEIHPKIYMESQSGSKFNVKVFWRWVLNAVFHSAIIFFGSLYFFGTWIPGGMFVSDSVFPGSGRLGGLYVQGLLTYTVVLVVVILKAALLTSTWVYPFTFLCIFGSIALWLVVAPLYAFVNSVLPTPPSPELNGAYLLFAHPGFYLTLLLLPAIALLRDYFIKLVRRIFYPTPVRTLQKEQKQLRQLARAAGKNTVLLSPVAPTKQVHIPWRSSFAFSQSSRQRFLTKRSHPSKATPLNPI